MKRNYAIIVLGNIKIEGKVDRCRYYEDLIDVRIDGTWYAVSYNNIMFIEK